MDDISQIEAKILELEAEVGYALFPITRDDFVSRRLVAREGVSETTMEWRRNNQAMMWLKYLQEIKREKDANTPMWRSMRNWN